MLFRSCIDFSNCVSLSDQVLTSACKIRLSACRESFERLSFANCINLSDSGLLHLVSKASSLIKGLRSVNLNFCNRVSPSGISKLLHCCKELQHLHLASNPSQQGMSDAIVQFIASEYNQRLQTLVLVRSTHLTSAGILSVAAQ